MKTQVNNNTLQTIRELFDACGPQSFSQILSEVRSQSLVSMNLSQAHSHVKDSLEYLKGLKTIIEQSDEFGVVYGHPSDF